MMNRKWYYSDHCLNATERGMVLILVLWISTGLGMVALLFGYSMMMEYRMGGKYTGWYAV
ncbi:MAG: hypothetical protein ACOX5R_15020 [bacterium]